MTGEHGRAAGVRRTLRTRVAVTAATLAVALAPAWGVPAAAAAPASTTVVAADSPASGSSTIAGTLVVPGPGRAPSGVTVTLLAVPTSGASVTRTAVSRPDGTFTFAGLAGGDWVYTLSAPYQGTTFSSDPLSVPAGQGLSVRLPLYAPTTSPAAVTTTSWTVWLDVTGDRLAVQQDVALRNTGSAAYTGTDPVAGAPDGGRAAVVLPVAPGAEGFEFLGRFEVCCSGVQAGAWAHTRPVAPGTSTGTLRYEAPTTSTLSFRAQFATDKLTLLVPDGTTASSPQLTSSGTSTDRGVTYRVWTSGALRAGDTVTVSLVLPQSTGTAAWWITAAAIGLAAVVVGGVLLRRRRARPSPDPAATSRPATSRPARATTTSSSAERRRGAEATARSAGTSRAPTRTRSRIDVLTDELAALDLAFEDGALTDEASYRRVRETLVQQLVDVVGPDQPAATARH